MSLPQDRERREAPTVAPSPTKDAKPPLSPSLVALAGSLALPLLDHLLRRVTMTAREGANL